MNVFDDHAVEVMRSGGVGVIPTDTVYGIVCRADKEASVERLYRVRGRNPLKPCIILIASIDDLATFTVTPTRAHRAAITRAQLWPGAVSIIFPAPEAPQYLTRGTGTLAFRLPSNPALHEFLAQTGPLLAPSANPESAPPATTIEEARAYFTTAVDLYVDAGRIEGLPSTILSAGTDGFDIVRAGNVVPDQHMLRYT